MAPAARARDRGVAASSHTGNSAEASVPPSGGAATTSPAKSLLTENREAETAVWPAAAHLWPAGPAGPARGALQLPLPAVAHVARKPERRRTPLLAVGAFAVLAALLVGAYLIVSTTILIQCLTTALRRAWPAPGAPPTPDAPATASLGSNESGCYDFHATLNVHPLQVHSGNADSSVWGYAQLTLCTNGTMLSSSVLFDGRTQIVATHIHLTSTANGRDGDAAVGEGPPVINFCGSNNMGLADDGTPYPQHCDQWDSQSAATNKDVPGVLVHATNAQVTTAERIAGIVAKPHSYYFLVETMASITHWTPQQHGACRGPLELVGSI